MGKGTILEISRDKDTAKVEILTATWLLYIKDDVTFRYSLDKNEDNILYINGYSYKFKIL